MNWLSLVIVSLCLSGCGAEWLPEDGPSSNNTVQTNQTTPPPQTNTETPIATDTTGKIQVFSFQVLKLHALIQM